MKKLLTVLASAVFAAFVAGQGWTAENVAPPHPAELMTAASDMPRSETLHRATDLIGATVRNENNDLSGKVKDIVLSADMKKIEYLAVAFDGFNGLHRVPYQSVRSVTTTEGGMTHSALVCDVPRTGLEPMRLVAEKENAYPPSDNALRVSPLIGLDIQDRNGSKVGDLRDLIVASDGRIREATLGLGGFLGIGEKLASIPWNNVEFMRGEKYAKVTMTVDEVKGLAYNKDDYWQRLGFGGKSETKDTRY